MTSPLDAPLVPLPPPTTEEHVIHSDPNDLFESLFTAENAIFQSQRPRRERHEDPSLYPDFGAFVSVPASQETKVHPLLFEFDDKSSPDTEVKPRVSDFFDQITEEAKKNSEQNQRRVVNQISKHEQDSLLWLESSDHSSPVPPFINQQQSLPSTALSDYMIHPHTATSSQTLPERADPWQTSTVRDSDNSSSLSTATLPRKWVSSFLSASVPSLPYTARHNSVKLPPKQQSTLPSVTHSSPFAPHIFIPPSGAPGFTGDYSGNKSGFVFDENDRHLRKLKLEGRKETTTPVLRLELAEKIRTNLPPLLRLAKSWTLFYSLDQHGVSLQTLYARCAKISSTLLVIQDSEDCMFGVWIKGPIHSSASYYGTGDSFLWTSKDQNNVQIFKWTGKNDYVAFCEKDFLSFGGGTGKYGLYLSENLTDGSSAPCPTFDNSALSGRDAHDTKDVSISFECVGIEIWGISS